MDVDRSRGLRQNGWSLPWRTFLLATLALAGTLFLGAAPEAWVFDRTAIVQGEIWRLVTGHWVHSDPEHAIWDISALVILGVVFENHLRGRLLLALAIGTLSIDAWLIVSKLSPHAYCGLSGILNSLLAAGLVQCWRRMKHPVIWLTGLGAIAKIILEITTGQALLTETAWPSVPEVHAVGFFSGLLLGATLAAVECFWSQPGITCCAQDSGNDQLFQS